MDTLGWETALAPFAALLQLQLKQENKEKNEKQISQNQSSCDLDLPY